MNTEQKVEHFAERELGKLAASVILQDSENQYIAFGQYHIRSTDSGVEVRNLAADLIGKFSNKRTALGFCTADKYKYLNLAFQIRNLDAKKQILDNDLQTARGSMNRGRSYEFREIVDTKMRSKILQHQSVCRELEKCVNSAKYLQIKGFQNETARVFTNQTH